MHKLNDPRRTFFHQTVIITMDSSPNVADTESSLKDPTQSCSVRGIINEMPDYLSIADVLVLLCPSGENAPLKVFNYITSQKPIVATRFPAHTSVLSESSAYFVTPDSFSLSRGIIYVLQNQELLKNLLQTATVARAIQGDRYSLKHAMLDAYTHAIQREGYTISH